MIATIFLPILFLFQAPSITATPRARAAEMPKPAVEQKAAEQKEEAPSITKHSIRVGSKSLNYTATAGFIPLKNAVSGEVEAKVFYMAYTLDNPPAGRPLMFSFNGGPGSSSVWLHLGALGPRRVKMLDDGMMPPPPYEMEDNQQTWLTETDLVFIDPVGTGYSRASKPELAQQYWSLNGDIASVGEFIRLYLSRNDRWLSPLFVIGESYGTTRASGLSNWLIDRGIALNGIALVSTVLNFQTLLFANSNDLPLVLILPSYATTAWYHKKLSPAMQAKSVAQIAKEAEDFAMNEYMPAMMRIDRLTSAERQNLLDKFNAYTGLSKEFIERNNFRVELGEFNKELLRSERRTTGRFDSRFKGIDRDAAGANPNNDPSFAVRPPYTAAFNDYVRRELSYKTDVEYTIIGGAGRWDFNANNGYADTSISLKDAMAKNPYMKIFLAQGYYDMATPFFAAEYTVSAMNLDPTLRKNISFEYYDAGHMMYIDVSQLNKFKTDAAAFISGALKH